MLALLQLLWSLCSIVDICAMVAFLYSIYEELVAIPVHEVIKRSKAYFILVPVCRDVLFTIE